jgi:hypothetical protein
MPDQDGFYGVKPVPVKEFSIAIARGSQIVCEITKDGSVVLAEGISVDEAARAFWDAVEQMAPLGRSLTRL